MEINPLSINVNVFEIPRVIPTGSGISYLFWAKAVFMHVMKKIPITHIFSLPYVMFCGNLGALASRFSVAAP